MIARVVLKFLAEEVWQVRAAGIAEQCPECGAIEAAEITNVTRGDLEVFDRWCCADVDGRAEVDFGTDFEGAAVVAEEIAGEAVA